MKKLLVIAVICSVLSACSMAGAGSVGQWENEEVSAAANPILADDISAEWEVEGGAGNEGHAAAIRLTIRNYDGKPIEKFDITHEKLLHFIVISKDLSYFNHIHPDYKGNGVFEIANSFPAGGEYRFIADFKPTGTNSMTKMAWMKIEGETATRAPVVPDESLENLVDGYKIQLAIDGLEAKEQSTLTFSITDENTEEPVDDLQPYLGAIGHVVILSEDGERYLHVHAEEGQGTGPEAVFETQFPRSGLYKIWGQFQRDNHVFTASYVVNIP